MWIWCWKRNHERNIYILRAVTERSIEVQQDLYLCFVYFSKAFDTVKYEKFIQMLQDINIDGKDLQLIKNVYWQQTAAIKINNNISGYQKIKKGVRLGCVLSPELFSLYSEITLSTVKDRPGIRIGGANINNLQYAHDIVLIAKKRRRITRFVTYDQRREWKYGIEFEY